MSMHKKIKVLVNVLIFSIFLTTFDIDTLHKLSPLCTAVLTHLSTHQWFYKFIGASFSLSNIYPALVDYLKVSILFFLIWFLLFCSE